MIAFDTELAKIKGIGQKFGKKLEKLNIRTVRDLLWHFPFRYEDYSEVVKIAQLKPNQSVTVVGEVKRISMRRTLRKRMVLVEAIIADETGGVKALWFNQPYVTNTLRVGRRVNFAGKLISKNGEIYLSNPAYELLSGTAETKHTAGLVPIYPETKNLTSRGLRFLMKPILRALPRPDDFIPDDVREENNIPDLATALHHIHFPKTAEQAERARIRFAFEDLFLLQLNNLRTRDALTKERAYPLTLPEDERSRLVTSLPFELTASQVRCVDEIMADIVHPAPMNRLLQGDVGSGKTVVAAIAARAAAHNGTQAVFMAPTEVLARQHYKTLTGLLPRHAIALLVGGEVRVCFGDNLHEKKTRAQLLKEIARGEIQIIVGTHAVIQKSVSFNDLGLAVIDEQHRFGVKQRAELIAKNTKAQAALPHFLSMSATPIPRTLALTVFGDLDISIIDELPKGRKPIMTKVVAPGKRAAAYQFIRNQVKEGRQVFVICPRIVAAEADVDAEEKKEPAMADKRKAMWSEVKNVTEEFEKLSQKVFPDLAVEMLHGKMKGKEKEEVMARFVKGETNILVSTSVIEVGIDVPNATIMMIEGADRFGLSQLYQFRGRVGRGEHQSYCLLFADSDSLTTQQRLEALMKAKNGFELAEYDLKLRGPGQFLGEKQTGIPDLAMQSLDNLSLVKGTRLAAAEILKSDPALTKHLALKERLAAFRQGVHLE